MSSYLSLDLSWMASPRVSVALCTFNGAPYLREQLASIANQSLAVDEIVVADDGSSDDTISILTEASNRLPIRLLPPQGHLGVAQNFARAMSSSTGHFLLLSDQDDVWNPQRVAAQVEALEADPGLLLVHSDARLIDATGRVLDGSLLDRLRADQPTRDALISGASLAPLLRRNLVTGATVALRRALVDTALPIPEPWLHDEWLAMMAAIRGASRLLPDQLIDYRLHGLNEVGAHLVTLKVRLDRLSEPRERRNIRLLARASTLAVRVPDDPTGMLGAKLAHEQVRSQYPRRHLMRLVPILKEALTGRYRQFGRGADDIVRDIVQPAG